MVLGITVLNQLTTVGIVNQGEVVCRFKIRSDPLKTPFEYVLQIKETLNQHKYEMKQVQKMVVASVVPPITRVMKELGEETLKIPTLIVAPGIKTGLSLKVENPKEVGADIITLAVGALSNYQPPFILVNCDTATTFSVVNQSREFIGVAIAPGLYNSLNSLIEKTALLPGISLDTPREVIGKNTEEALKSGFVYGFAGMIDSMVERIQESQAGKFKVIASGDCFSILAPYLKNIEVIDEDLGLKGLYQISVLNSGLV